MYCKLQSKVEQETILVSSVKSNLRNDRGLLLKISNTLIYFLKIQRLWKCFNFFSIINSIVEMHYL